MENAKQQYCIFFLQYCYSAILNIELHCSKYCKKIIIFYLTLSPLSLISRPCLSSLSLHRRTQHPQPSTISCHPQQPPTSQHHRADPLIPVSSSPNPTPYHTIRNSHPQPSTTEHNPRICDLRPTIQHGETNTAIHDPRSTTGAMRVRARHGANEVLGFIEAKL